MLALAAVLPPFCLSAAGCQYSMPSQECLSTTG